MAKRGYKATEPILRLNEKYIVDSETGCWQWIASKNEQGYGKFSITRCKWVHAHRFAYEYYVGQINDLYVLHKCDNPACCNPNHLFLGTQKDNMIDCKNKNRNHKPIGELCGRHILKENEVIEIKKRLQNFKYGDCLKISKEYGVDPRTISNIKCGINWTHIHIS
jgi:hypothetical protein